MKMTLNEEIELLRNGKWFGKIGGTLPNDEYLNLGWAIGDVLDTLELLRMLQPKVETNADRIRSMSDENMARWLAEWSFCADACPASTNEVEEAIGYHCPSNCKEQALTWLQQPTEEET